MVRGDDIAAEVAGLLGIPPMADLNPKRWFLRMSEPILSPAFAITRKRIASPIGTSRTACPMLDYPEEPDAASRMTGAMEVVAAHTGDYASDIGGRATTHPITNAIRLTKNGAAAHQDRSEEETV